MVVEDRRITGPNSPFELVIEQLDGQQYRVFRHAPRNLLDIFKRFSYSAGRTLLVHGGRRVTYGQVVERASRLSAGLSQRFGVTAGTRVAIVLPNSIAWIISFVAVTSSGGVAVLLDHESGPSDLSKKLGLAGCSMLIADERTALELRGIQNCLPTLIVGDMNNESVEREQTSFELLIRDSQPRRDIVSIEPDQEALIAFTSGTSALPKGVVSTHRCLTHGLMNSLLGAALTSARSARRQSGHDRPRPPQGPPRSLLMAPFSYIAGYAHLISMSYLGGTIVIAESKGVDAVAKQIIQEETRSLVGATPPLIIDLLHKSGADQVLSRLSSIGVHGAALDQRILAELMSVMPPSAINTGYGMTETCGSICVASGEDLIEKPGVSGPVLPSFEVRISCDEPTGASADHGEIWVRGAAVMKEYCGQPALTSDVLQNSWFRTGDIGYLDSDGFLFVEDRKSQVVTWSGKRISFANIERFITENRIADKVVVLDSAGQEGRQRLMIAVECRRTCRFDEAPIRDYLGSLGIEDSRDCDIVVLEGLPSTSSGKIDRRELRRMFDERHRPDVTA